MYCATYFSVMKRLLAGRLASRCRSLVSTRGAGVLLIGLLLIGVLPGCTWMQDMGAPHVYGPNEVPPEVLAQPRLVAHALPAGPTESYPRLSDVPPRPKDFSPQPLVEQTQEQLEAQRDEALLMKQQVDNPEIPNKEVSGSSPDLTVEPRIPSSPITHYPITH